MGHKLVCLNCKISQNIDSDFTKHSSLNRVCVICNNELVLLPHRFRPPSKNETKKWEIIKFLFDNGFRFEHIQVNESYVKIPETMYEAKEFIKKYL